jgi:hypothetical protein
MGNPLPAEIYSIYTESNGLQKLLTYFLDSLPSSLNGITKKKIFFFFLFELKIAMIFLLFTHTLLGNRYYYILINTISHKFNKVSVYLFFFR